MKSMEWLQFIFATEKQSMGEDRRLEWDEDRIRALTKEERRSRNKDPMAEAAMPVIATRAKAKPARAESPKERGSRAVSSRAVSLTARISGAESSRAASPEAEMIDADEIEVEVETDPYIDVGSDVEFIRETHEMEPLGPIRPLKRRRKVA